MTSYVFHGKIHTSLASAPQALIDSLADRGLIPAPNDPVQPPLVVDNDPPADDLTVIKGLGAARAKQLNDVGIHALDDLANADPNLLEKIDGISLANAVDWVNEASSIARGID